MGNKEEISSRSDACVFIFTCNLLVAPGITTLTSSCIKIHLIAKSVSEKLFGSKFFNFSTASRPFLKFTPENVSPTIQGRDFVIATVAAPTIVKEPEKPAEESAEGTEVAEGAEGAETTPSEGAGEKSSDADKNKETDKKTDKKEDQKGNSEKK